MMRDHIDLQWWNLNEFQMLFETSMRNNTRGSWNRTTRTRNGFPEPQTLDGFLKPELRTRIWFPVLAIELQRKSDSFVLPRSICKCAIKNKKNDL